MKFSQTHGYSPVRSQIQVEDMDEDLRTAIWNVLYAEIFRRWRSLVLDEADRCLGTALWTEFLKWRLDYMPATGRAIFDVVNEWFFNAQWYEVFDLTEFLCQSIVDRSPNSASRFTTRINEALSNELSAWRVIGQKLVRLTAEEEIAAIEEAEILVDRFAPAAIHVREAVAKLADRKSRDFRNSIKESISAVEAACRIATGERTLGKALKRLSQKGIIVDHAIESAFEKLYGYTNGPEGGIRHAHLGTGSVDHDDAKFMLVACSAFVNLVRARAT